MTFNKIKKVSSGAKWEDIVGYSRAIRSGNTIEVSGTIAIDKEGKVVGEGNAYEQTKFIIGIAETAIKHLGGSLNDVTRTRIFTTDISGWEEIGKAHGEFFKTIKPATSMIEISKLIIPETVVEIEFTAIINRHKKDETA